MAVEIKETKIAEINEERNPKNSNDGERDEKPDEQQQDAGKEEADGDLVWEDEWTVNKWKKNWNERNRRDIKKKKKIDKAYSMKKSGEKWTIFSIFYRM